MEDGGTPHVLNSAMTFVVTPAGEPESRCFDDGETKRDPGSSPG